MTSESLDAGARLRRLLAVLAYLAKVGRAPIAELAARFAMDEVTLIGELELAACCGLPPYTPDQLLELVVDDEYVVAYGLDALRQPPRLTPEEGFAVAAAARAMLAVPGAEGDGPLALALAKLQRVLGEDHMQIELDSPEHLGLLRRAVLDHELVNIEYLGARPGGVTTRTVEPHAVVALEGRFYLDAYCHLAEDWRRFQLDRVRDAQAIGRRFQRRETPGEMAGPRAFAGGPSSALVLVAVPASSVSLIDHVAAGPAKERADGRMDVPVRVGNPRWLGRLLLRLGPDAEVVYPEELRHARSLVASAALSRYQASTGT